MTDCSEARWFGVGSSTCSDSQRAGAQAAEGALSGADAKLAVVFYSDRHDPKAVLAGINATTGGIPLIGATTGGEIANGWAGDAAVVVTAIGGTEISATTAMACGVSTGHRAAGASVAACVERLDAAEHRVLLMLPDGLAGSQQEIIRGAYSVLGAQVPLVGGCAGDGMRMRQTTQLYHDEVLTDAVVAAALGSSMPFGIGVQHGWRQVGTPMIVAKSAGGRVYRLGQEPALDAYLRLLDAPAAAHHDPAAFAAFAMVHPLGLVRQSCGQEMRFISDADFTERALVCFADVPQGCLAWVTEGDAETILDATVSACDAAVEGLGGNPPLGFLAFDCVSRRGVLGAEGISTEASQIARLAAGAPVAGFYTYGEIARVRGINGYHNQTLVVLAMS